MRWTLGLTLLLEAIVAAWSVTRPLASERLFAWAASSGLLATALLGLSLLGTPLGRWFPVWVRGSTWRRSFGLAAAVAALLHAVTVSLTAMVPSWWLWLYEPQLRAGAVALLVLLAMAATSFPRRWSPRGWRWLHRLVWAAAGSILLHVVLSSRATSTEVGVIALGIAGLGLLRLAAWAQGSRVGSSVGADTAS